MENAVVSNECLKGPQGRLFIHRSGTEGSPVLFVHGNGGRGSQWKGSMTFLADRQHQAAALDLRGMGASDPPSNGDYSVGGFADDVAAAADHLRLDRFFLVGHSLGASVAACFAGRYPRSVLGLVLVDFGGDLRDDSPEDLAFLVDGLAPAHFKRFSEEAMATCLKEAEPAVVAQVLADLEATPRTHFAGAVFGLLDFDPVAVLTQSRVRALHVYSPCLEAMKLEPIHRRVRGMESMCIAKCSHWVHLDQPERFNQALLQFIESIRRT